jgi:3-oxoadipate enol-lactonase
MIASSFTGPAPLAGSSCPGVGWVVQTVGASRFGFPFGAPEGREMMMPQVTGRGTRLYYGDTGAGPVMLLSHSWWCDGRQWPQVPVLVDAGYRVLNLDNRGHGQSGPHREPFTIWDMADDLISVLDDAGVDETVVVGLSIGGMAGIRAAVRYPDRVRALVLTDTGAAAQGLVNRVKIAALSPVWRTPARRFIASQVVNVLFGATARRDQPELVATWRDRFLAQDPASMMTVGHALVQRDDVTARLAEIRVPTLVIVGEQDVDPGVAASVALAARIPGARFIALPDTGHLSALEQPEAFGAALLRFADALPPSAD